MHDGAHILVADDSTTVRTLVSKILRRAGFVVTEAVDGIDAYAKIVLHHPDVAIVDWSMPGCSGLDVLRRVKADPSVAPTAMVVLTASDDRSLVRECLAAGAADYLRKPCDPSELVARVRNVASSKRQVDELLRQSTTDFLTGLPNRRGIRPVVDALKKPSTPFLGVALIDVDHFKSVNDTHGHGAGDAVLRVVAGRLSASSSQFTVARWGGEEFAAIGGVSSPQSMLRAGDKFRRAVGAAPIDVDVEGTLHSIDVTVSVGATVVDVDDDLDEAYDIADAALYAAKEAGRNRVGLVALGELRVLNDLRTTVSPIEVT